MQRLKSRVAVVTGGASGLGRSIAERLAADGAQVVITDIQLPLGEAVARECGFMFLQQDVRDEVQWARTVQTVEECRGRLDILVNNAGISGPLDATNPENSRLSEWKEVFAVNVESVFLGCRAAIPAMRRSGGGSIVNVSSIAGLLATPYAMAYGATKAAVGQMTKSVAQHCAQEKLNIRCNSVHPSAVLTPLWTRQAHQRAQRRGVPVETVVAKAKMQVPLGDLTLPEDVAAAVSFLASDDARRLTGTKVVVDGGLIGCDTFWMSAEL